MIYLTFLSNAKSVLIEPGNRSAIPWCHMWGENFETDIIQREMNYQLYLAVLFEAGTGPTEFRAAILLTNPRERNSNDHIHLEMNS